MLAQVDLLLVPTALHHCTVAEIEAEEKAASQPTWANNAKLGRFTNFVNLLDMCGVSVPSGLLHCPALSADKLEGAALSELSPICVSLSIACSYATARRCQLTSQKVQLDGDCPLTAGHKPEQSMLDETASPFLTLKRTRSCTLPCTLPC